MGRIQAALNCLMGRSTIYKMIIDFDTRSVISQTEHAVMTDNNFKGINKIGTALPLEKEVK